MTDFEYQTAAALAPLPVLRGMSDVPLDPTCPGDRHGSYRAYTQHRCRCPDVLDHMVAYRARQDARAMERLAALPAELQPRSPFDVDDGDVEAALWRARRELPMPAGLTLAEVRTVIHRLRELGFSAGEISTRVDLSERQVQRLLTSPIPAPPPAVALAVVA